MSIVPYPSPNHHNEVGLRPMVSSLVNRSELTNARQAVDTGYSWWDARISVANMSRGDARGWLLFFGRVRGPTHSFRVPVSADAQHEGNFTVRARGSGFDYQLLTDGWPPSSTPLLAADLVTVGDQLMRLDENVVADASGIATLKFHAPLRRIVTDNTVVEAKRPWLLASLPENSPMLTIGLARIQAGFSFDVSEAY